MNIGIDPKVFELCPNFIRYTLISKNIDNKGNDQELLEMLRQAEDYITKSDEFSDIKQNPKIVVWRDLFTSFGINPNQCPPSIANLIKRIRNGKELPFVNKLVAIFNIISLTHVIPAGGDDLNKVTGNIILKPAIGDEIYMHLGASEDKDFENPKKDEIILVDSGSNHVLCRAWCWKNGDSTKITPDTTFAAINLDVIPPMNKSNGDILAETAKKLIEKHCNASVDLYILDKDNPSITI